MTDNDIIRLIRTRLTQYVVACGYIMPVLQRQMPDQQGTEKVEDGGEAIYVQKLFDYHWGYPMTTETYDVITDIMTETTTQNLETTIQVGALVLQDPRHTNKPTASDVVNGAAMWLQKRETLRLFALQGVNIKPVTNVANPYMEDDRHRNEAYPSFNIVLSHTLSITNTVECTNVINPLVYPLQ